MRAWILDESPGSYRWGEIDTPEPGRDEVRVRPVASALNHMDVWLTKGLPKPDLPHVPGCDVAGVVDAVGEGVVGVAEGDEVVVNPSVSCRRCHWCLAGESPYCDEFAILGEEGWGGHAEGVVVPAANVVPRPAGRSWEECAAYPLATLTAWRMLRRARLTAGETVLVVGIGGGVAMAALALAKWSGATVVVTSRDAGKRERALALGADAAVDSSADRWDVKADVVVESVGAATWAQSVRSLKKGGRLVLCGGTSGTKVELNLPRLWFSQHEVIGSTMGSYGEFDEVTRLVAAGLPVQVDVVEAIDAYPAALDRLARGEQMGKIVLRHD
jgi:NADPH:quinone reductase-like Zn-dependent oxidoreductase